MENSKQKLPDSSSSIVYDPEYHPLRATGREARIPRYAYLPFGGGPRACIGNGFAMMEAVLILATVAPRWQVLLEPDPKVVPVQLVTLRRKDGIRMKLKAA